MLLVLGPHRSGTSLAARMLECLGAVNSTNLNPANEFNPRGYFEDWDVYQFNEHVLLPALGRSWHSLGLIDWSVLTPEILARLRAEAGKILARNYCTANRVSVLKDPRISRLLPFWLPVLAQAGFKPGAVFCLRDPRSIARSLTQRDETSPAHGQLVSLVTWLALASDWGEAPAAFIQFSDLLQSPRETALRVAARLGLQLPPDFEQRIADFTGGHIDPSLCHSRSDYADPANDTKILEPVRQCFAAVRDAEARQSLAPLRKFAASLSHSFQALEPIMEELDELQKRLAEAESGPRHPTAVEPTLTAREVERQRHREETSELRQFLAAAEARMEAMRRSTSWRLTAPLRMARRLSLLPFSRPRSLRDSLCILLRHRRSGLFDPAWYWSANPDVRKAAVPPFQHFAMNGVFEGRAPNPYFDRAFYLQRNPDAGPDPVLHYALVGYGEDRDCCPLFDRAFYAAQLPSGEGKPPNLLAHYAHVGWKARMDPHAFFSVGWYLAGNPDVAAEGVEPLRHFITSGALEGRSPREDFDGGLMFRRQPWLLAARVNPLTHYLGERWGADPCPEFTVSVCLQALCSEDASPESIRRTFLPPLAVKTCRLDRPVPVKREQPDDVAAPDIRAIAIYLPQFHTIPENDAWWGQGFTEWTNVRRGTPHYPGHYQPHIPHSDLGYYDLNDPSVMKQQATMARAAGIEGFCFYYYWFGGRRLLEKPLERMLATGSPDFPFCICWANENWTRRWDGRDDEVLIAQDHTPDESERFIRDLLPTLKDPRYIRVGGRPLLIVYRPSLLPNARAAAQCWRRVCRREGIGEICLAYMQREEEASPREIGFDYALQFPPLRANAPDIHDEVGLFEPGRFTGKIYDYRRMALSYALAASEDDVWPCVCPSWDNTARIDHRAHSSMHATPENYRLWLAHVAVHLRERQPREQRLVFINAWNEWAEGNHLEPDQRHGYAWLNATRQALTPPSAPGGRILVVGHDANRAGAQLALLALLKEWSATKDAEILLVLEEGGPLRRSYEDVVPTVVLSDWAQGPDRSRQLLEVLRWSPAAILNNTVANGELLDELAALMPSLPPVVTHVHELQAAIERWAPGAIMAGTRRHTARFIACSAPVSDNLVSRHRVPPRKITLVLESIKCTDGPLMDDAAKRARRPSLGLPPDALVVAGCGTTDWRKGVDLFVATAVIVARKLPHVCFVWVGAVSEAKVGALWQSTGLGQRLHFTGERVDARELIAASDIFFLSSREDPLPLVALEAADAGLPVVAFAGSGGMTDFLAEEPDLLAPMEDSGAAASAILRLHDDPALRRELGEAARSKVRRSHHITDAAQKIMAVLQDVARRDEREKRDLKHQAETVPDVVRRTGPKPLVSVVVPCYNHAHFLPERLGSILSQGIDDMEIILLDDGSTDASPEILAEFCGREPRARLLTNESNTGSPFRQWRKGLAEARGDFVWIAESDDSAEPGLLRALLAIHRETPDLALCYAQSLLIDLASRPLGHGSAWTDDISLQRWSRNYIATGPDELANALCFKNTIPNVSAVLFRNSTQLAALVDPGMRLCGDWLTYTRLCGLGGMGYAAAPLNLWRQSSSNARTKPAGEMEWAEGAVVIGEIGRRLHWDEAELTVRLEEFHQKCEAWGGRA
jgi:glycosyltransferase involved in cell wall biosynthesis